MLRYVIPLVLATLLTTPSWAGEMTFTMVGFKVQASGLMTSGTLKRFKKFTEENDVRGAEIFFNSNGGLTHEGTALGREVRRLSMRTRVGIVHPDGTTSPGTCASMCPYVLLAGVKRSVVPGSTIEVHQIRVNEKTPDANDFSYDDISLIEVSIADMARYLVDIGASARILDYSLRVSYKGKLKVLSQNELKAIGLR